MLSTSAAIALIVFIALIVLFMSALVSVGFNSIFKRDIRYRVISTSITALFAFLITFIGAALCLGPLSRWWYGPTTELSMDAIKLLILLSATAALISMLTWQMGMYQGRRTNP